MKIRRSRLTADFVQIPNQTARDGRMSYMARGILAELLSRPDGWEATADDLWCHAKQVRGEAGESRRAFRAAFTELKTAGYLVASRERLDGGRFGTVVTVYDVPQTGIPAVGTSARAGETPKAAGQTGVPAGGMSVMSTGVPTAGTPERAGQTSVPAGRTGIPPVGTSVRPGQTDVSAAHSDVPTVGTSSKKTGLENGKENVSLSATEQKIMRAVGATPEEAREIISLIQKRKNPEHLGAYIGVIISNEDMPGWLARVRTGERADVARPSSTPNPPSWTELTSRQVCQHGEPDGDKIRPGSGTAKCPQCRRGAPAYVQPAPSGEQERNPFQLAPPTDKPSPVRPRPPLLAPQTSRGMAPAFPPAPAPEITPVPPEATPEPTGQLPANSQHLPALGAVPAPMPAPIPVDTEKADAAREYLKSRGDFFEWMTAAREKLGNDADSGEVFILAAELAKAS